MLQATTSSLQTPCQQREHQVLAPLQVCSQTPSPLTPPFILATAKEKLGLPMTFPLSMLKGVGSSSLSLSYLREACNVQCIMDKKTEPCSLSVSLPLALTTGYMHAPHGVHNIMERRDYQCPLLVSKHSHARADPFVLLLSSCCIMASVKLYSAGHQTAGIVSHPATRTMTVLPSKSAAMYLM